MIPYIITDTTVTFIVDNAAHTVEATHPNFRAVLDALKANDPDTSALVALAQPAVAVAKALQSAVDCKYLEPGVVEVTVAGVTYDGDMIAKGFDVQPWLAFMANLYRNPVKSSRDELYEFLEQADLPITSDGHFIAYKKVREDYRDIHSGTIDNSVGQVVEMPRTAVDPDRNNTCSAGLHFCSKDYLPHFGATDGNRVVLVKINPADVVSIPTDYSFTKGRTWRYEVVGEIEFEEAFNRQWEPVTYEFDDYDTDDTDDGDNDWDDYDDDTSIV
jgi:hypothetical protein